MTTSSQLPHIPKDLLDALDKKFPERCPDIGMSDREIWVMVGQRKVIRHLMTIFDQQNSNVLSNSLLNGGGSSTPPNRDH